eukprot:343345-Chlamydomonas_euryale.AAC.3
MYGYERVRTMCQLSEGMKGVSDVLEVQGNFKGISKEARGRMAGCLLRGVYVLAERSMRRLFQSFRVCWEGSGGDKLA